MEQLMTGGQNVPSISPDGNVLVLLTGRAGRSEDGANTNITMYDLRSKKAIPYLNTKYNEQYPDFSPDGRWLTYTSNQTERDEVYIRPYPGPPGPGGERRISADGGKEPLWARDGKQLFWRLGDASELQVWAVNINLNQNPPAVSAPELKFKLQGYGSGTTVRFAWDVSLDGRKFLMYKVEERVPQPVTEMILVENWFEELRSQFNAGQK